jgi:hypothetical protein
MRSTWFPNSLLLDGIESYLDLLGRNQRPAVPGYRTPTTILPVCAKDHKIGKWSLSWEGPYKIVKVITKNSYLVDALQGEHFLRALNGRYLKKYYPTV